MKEPIIISGRVEDMASNTTDVISKASHLVITTVNPVTKGVRKFLNQSSLHTVLVADRKTPDLENQIVHKNTATFYSVEQQQKSGFRLHEHMPFNHYCRKNLGYLYAMQQNSTVIAETDDDNIPYNDWGMDCRLGKTGRLNIVNGVKYLNVYQFFTDELIWPRGLPLNAIHATEEANQRKGCAKIMIWQGLADSDPDVDAIFRLIFPKKQIRFKRLTMPIVLGQSVFCPFNSQNTIWSREAFPFLYLPMSVSFRFTDILRGFIAQRGIWALGGLLAFGNASVYQERNQHNLMKDFHDEVEVYMKAGLVIDVLDQLSLSGDACEDLKAMYQILYEYSVVSEHEIKSVDAWIADLQFLGVLLDAYSG